ncbi:MAG: histidine phosphatase family protein [Pseudomonadota bacterium]
MTTVYLIRHGKIPQVAPRCFIGQQDLPLTDQGRRQITRLAEYLATKAIDRVVTSPLLRCRQSTDILCGRLQNMNAEVNANLREISLGTWEGQSVAQVRARFPGDYESRGQDPLHFRPSQGESFVDLLDRVWPTFQAIAATSSGKRVAIVTHAGVIRVLLFRILAMIPNEFFHLKLDYGCLTVLDHDGSCWRAGNINFQP